MDKGRYKPRPVRNAGLIQNPASSINSVQSEYDDDDRPLIKVQGIRRICSFRCVMICLLITMLLGIAAAAICYSVLKWGVPDSTMRCSNSQSSCSMILVESIPEDLTYPPGSVQHMSTYEGWMELLDSAKTSVDIASFYWTLNGTSHVHNPSDQQGEDIFNKLMSVGKSHVKVRIVQNQPTREFPNHDSYALAKAGAADVLSIDFHKMFGSGVLHTKFWIIDDSHFYIGSANMDWRSLTQVKELGVLALNCSCLTQDLAKVFSMYWIVAQDNSTLPDHWPPRVQTHINFENPLKIEINGSRAETTFGVSPPEFKAKNWTSDLALILKTIGLAQKQINIAVMDYSPTTLYLGDHNRYWPDIDDALRHAVFDRGVEVRLMASWWNHSNIFMKKFLRSLAAINSTGNYNHLGRAEVRLFIVPANSRQQKIPFARVNHNKYMVTDNAAFIGTSNWSGDYFITTGGVGLLVNQTKAEREVKKRAHLVQSQLQAVFDRDWNSPYAHPLEQ